MSPSRIPHRLLSRGALGSGLLLLLACSGGGGSNGGGGSTAITITTQPSSTTVTAPEGATFTVKASGTATFQWRRNGTPITGATSDTLTVAATDLQNPTTTYSVQVTGGGATVTSQDAVLTVMAPSPVWAGDPVPVPSRPLTVLPSYRTQPAFNNGAFRFGYDEALKNPVWTAYAAFRVATTFPNADREFLPDDRLAQPRVSTGDYGSHNGLFWRQDGTGFDRGHMVPLADISYRYGSAAGEDATLMSNIIPQVSTFNQGIWQKLEAAIGGSLSGGTFTDGLPGTFGRVWVYTGPVFTGTTTYWVPSTETYTQDPGSLPAGTLRIALPTGAFKVMVAAPAGATPKALAVLMPNATGLPNDTTRIKDYVTSVAQVEELTGLNLFPNAPSSIPNLATWKATVDVRGWGTTFERSTGPNVAAVKPSWDLRIPQGTTVEFLGAATPNSQGGAVSTDTGCTWTFTGGLPAATGLSASRTFATAGTYTATFTATDSLGASTSVSRVITVLGENVGPTFTPDVIPDASTVSGTPVSVNVTVADDYTPPEQIQVTASSGNPTLLPESGVALSKVGGAVALTLTPAAGQTGTALVTLTARDGSGLSTSRTFSLVVAEAQGPMLTEGFEGGTKGAYAAGDVTLATGTWTLTDALIGDTTSDRKVGAKSVRVRNSGSVSMKFDWPSGAKAVSLQHAKYGTDGNSTWELWASTNGGAAWNRVGDPVTTSSTELQTATFTLNLTGAVRFEVRKTDGTSARLNLDTFQVVGQ